MLKKKKLVLASGSPRRKELLGHLNINFNVHPSDVVEETDFTAPTDVVIDLAKLKGDDIFSKEDSHSLIISSDTIVVIDDKILGKPNDREHAKEMLESLSGRTHEVYTAVYMKASGPDGEVKSKAFYVKTEVEFETISDDIMKLYLDSNDPYDKAGAYGIQNQGLLFVKQIKGSYSNVVGFPLSDFIREFKGFIDDLGYGDIKLGELFE